MILLYFYISHKTWCQNSAIQDLNRLTSLTDSEEHACQPYSKSNASELLEK